LSLLWCSTFQTLICIDEIHCLWILFPLLLWVLEFCQLLTYWLVYWTFTFFVFILGFHFLHIRIRLQINYFIQLDFQNLTYFPSLLNFLRTCCLLQCFNLYHDKDINQCNTYWFTPWNRKVDVIFSKIVIALSTNSLQS
jgi:hypothetical protein